MRTVSFSNKNVQNTFNNQFVCCYTNTKGDPSSGMSFEHSPSDEPGPCGKSAGRQNVQTIFMTPKGEIFHVATGYLDTKDLLAETKFARDLFGDMKGKSSDRQIVADTHRRFLQREGFSPQEISAQENMMDEISTGFSPQDLGIKTPTFERMGIDLPDQAKRMFGDVTKKRMLKDHKFVINNPLLSHNDFERNPQALVGHHKSFFGTNAAMNQATQQLNSIDRNIPFPGRRR